MINIPYGMHNVCIVFLGYLYSSYNQVSLVLSPKVNTEINTMRHNFIVTSTPEQPVKFVFNKAVFFLILLITYM